MSPLNYIKTDLRTIEEGILRRITLPEYVLSKNANRQYYAPCHGALSTIFKIFYKYETKDFCVLFTYELR